MTTKPGISPIAAAKLATLKPSFLLMPPDEALAFVTALRARRIKPAATLKTAKSKPAKAAKPKKPAKGEPADAVD